MKSGDKGKDKLYRQWMEHGDLPSGKASPQKDIPSKDIPPRTIPQEESIEEIPLSREETKRRSPLLYILLAVSITMLCVGLVLIFT